MEASHCRRRRRLFRIVHARGAIFNETGPTHGRGRSADMGLKIYHEDHALFLCCTDAHENPISFCSLASDSTFRLFYRLC